LSCSEVDGVNGILIATLASDIVVVVTHLVWSAIHSAMLEVCSAADIHWLPVHVVVLVLREVAGVIVVSACSILVTALPWLLWLVIVVIVILIVVVIVVVWVVVIIVVVIIIVMIIVIVVVVVWLIIVWIVVWIKLWLVSIV